jgi:hypothetical protein
MHRIQVFEIDGDAKETEIYKQTVPVLDLRALAALVNQKPRKPREPRAPTNSKKEAKA